MDIDFMDSQKDIPIQKYIVKLIREEISEELKYSCINENSILKIINFFEEQYEQYEFVGFVNITHIILKLRTL